MTLATEPYTPIEGGSATSPRGFRAGATASGIKSSGKLDLGLLVSERPCVLAGTFTPNAFPAAPVLVSRERVRAGQAQAVVFNSGNANACNGEQGLQDAREMARLAAARLGIDESLVAVASTGVIGQSLPMERVREGLPRLDPREDGGLEAARGMMTTDSHPKTAAVALPLHGGGEIHIGAMGKGVGMIHPNMATLLAFVTTDAALEMDFARVVLRRAVDRTFNMISVDGDTSTNDTCLLFANGLAGNAPFGADGEDARRFELGLTEVCERLAKQMARDGEGATKLIQVDVVGAHSEEDARRAARAVVRSNLFKAAVHGEDPNWGRVFMALGNSGARIDPSRVSLWIGDLLVARDGVGTGTSKQDGSRQMTGELVTLRIDLGSGPGLARAWGCDLTEQYVVENSAYTT